MVRNYQLIFCGEGKRQILLLGITMIS